MKSFISIIAPRKIRPMDLKVQISFFGMEGGGMMEALWFKGISIRLEVIRLELQSWSSIWGI